MYLCRYTDDPQSEVAYEFEEGPPVLCEITINLEQLLVRELPPEDRRVETPPWEEADAFTERIAVRCLRDRRRR